MTLSRRQFLQTALSAAVLAGASTIPQLSRRAIASPAPLNHRILLSLFLAGGPDLRHLVVPGFDTDPASIGYKYWHNRQRSHSLVAAGQTIEQRWNNDYEHFTVGGSNWPAGLVDFAGLNAGVTFGIWKEASWLIDMFKAGHVALVFNATGGRDRAHDLSTLKMHQGDLTASLNNANRSGWGGRLARVAGGSSIPVMSSPSPFCFGPLGDAPNFDPHQVDNKDLFPVSNSRELGLVDFDESQNQFYSTQQKLARAGKTYYASLRDKPQFNSNLTKFLQHEEKSRIFSKLIQARLDSVPIPNNIYGLYDDGAGLNVDPAGVDGARRVLRRANFGRQIRNTYDVIASNDLLNPSVISLDYGGWDSHSQQRQIPAVLSADPTNPTANRGIENGLRDIFCGKYGSSPINASALHCGFSALWDALSSADRQNIAVTIAGEFGRQIRDNGDYGTDHGKGNLMFVISERCQGGLYGELSQADELAKYDEPPNRTPDITPRTDLDHLFAAVSNWVSAGSGEIVFPRTASGFTGEAPIIEQAGMFDQILS